ncbi:MAG TPA: hypothetical protein PK675_00360 [Clostridia bacterium]|nr:hypothetical protein [Clostridia bacterium]
MDKFEYKKKTLITAEKLVSIYNNPVVKTVKNFIDEFPLLGKLLANITDNTLGSALKNHQAKKRKDFENFLLNTDKTITTEMVKDVEFIMNLVKSIEVIDRLTTNDKVVYFANLLRNAYLNGEKIQSDNFDNLFEKIKLMTKSDIDLLIKVLKMSKEGVKPLTGFGYDILVAYGFMGTTPIVETSVHEHKMQNEYDEDHTVTSEIVDQEYYLLENAELFEKYILRKANEQDEVHIVSFP